MNLNKIIERLYTHIQNIYCLDRTYRRTGEYSTFGKVWWCLQIERLIKQYISRHSRGEVKTL